MGLSADAWFSLATAILIGFFFFIKQRKEAIACYAIRSLEVIDVPNSSSHIGEKITVNYEDKPIPRVSVANVTFWNGGALILSGETLLPNYPLRICIRPGGDLLDATIVTNPNPECDYRISFDPDNFPNSVLLDFDFLEPDSGIVVRVLHTGQREAIDIEGKLKGVRLENAYSSAEKYDSILKFINYSEWILLGVLLLALAALVHFHTWIGLPEAFFLTPCYRAHQ
jgi:hypothetical protein